MIDPYSAAFGAASVLSGSPALPGPPSSFADPTLARARSALHGQSLALQGVRARIERASAELPLSSETEWAGPAREVYDWSLDETRRVVDRAREAVLRAIAATDLALEGLDRRG